MNDQKRFDGLVSFYCAHSSYVKFFDLVNRNLNVGFSIPKIGVDYCLVNGDFVYNGVTFNYSMVLA